MDGNQSLAVILPAYNEELTIERVIEDFHTHLPEAAIYIIDNRSSDRTGHVALKALERLHCKGSVISEPRPGKAFAVARAFRDVEADIYILADADFTYPASDARHLLQPVLDGRADIVVGDRHAEGAYSKENKRPFHNVGNGLVRWLVNTLFDASLHDILSGYRIMTRRFVKNYPILSRGFSIEAEMTLHALDKGFTIVELPTAYRDRPEGSTSKLRTFSDGSRVVRFIFNIFKNYRPLTFFGAVASFFLVAALLVGYPVIAEYIARRFILHIPSAILATGLMVLSLISLAIGLILDTVAANHRFDYQHKLLEYPLRSYETEHRTQRTVGE